VLADVTMHSKMDYRLGSYVPAAAAEGMNKQMGAMIANGVTLRIKGKRSYQSSGNLITIVDGEKGTITLLDPKGKKYATIPMADYADKVKGAMPEIPEAAKQMMANLKIDVKADKTGKTDVIKGIKVEELLVSMSMEMAPGMGMNMEMRMWAATAEDLARVPALKEIAAYMANQAAGTDPSATAAKMFAQLPGLADKLKAPMDKMMKASSQAVLRTEVKMMMPASAKMMGATNPDEPFTVMTTDMTELSTDAIPDSVFEVPAGYQEAKIEELVQLMNPAKQGQPQQQQPPPPPPAPLPPELANNPGPPPAGVFRVGGGVTPPKLVHKTEPSYTDEDRDARVQGSVRLYVQVNPEGKATNFRVLHSLSKGLDQQAIEAVKEWQFNPGMKNGVPVTVEAQIEVTFRLLDTPKTEVEIPRETQAAAPYPANATSPVLIRKVEAQYTSEARAAKFQGTVTLSAKITTDGVPEDIRVVHSLGLGLDEKAIEAVKQWQFRPATKDGRPVAMMATLEVNFRM
jgi:TonB family protein